jgi:hypothetical protein
LRQLQLAYDGRLIFQEHGARFRLRRLKRHRKVLSEQLRRFRTQLPQFAHDAEAAARPFLEQCKVLERIDCRKSGRKYQLVSPADAAGRLREATTLASKWTAFCNRPDVVVAVRAHNKAAKNAERFSRERTAEQLADPGLPGQLLKIWEKMKVMGLLIFNARGASWSHSHDELERLLDHRLIATTAASNGSARERLRAILARRDSSCVRQALEVVARVLVENEAATFHHSPSTPFIVGHQSYVLLESALVGFPEHFRREGLSPQEFLEKDLRLVGVDCSASAVPPG